MESIYQMQRRVRFSKGEPRFYHLDVKQLLGHRFIASRIGEKVYQITNFINENNRTFVSPKELGNHRLIKLLFLIPHTTNEAAAYLIELLEYLQQGGNRSDSSEAGDEETPMGFSAIELEFMYHYYITVKRLRDVIAEQDIEMTVETFFRLLGKMAASFMERIIRLSKSSARVSSTPMNMSATPALSM